MDKLRSIGKDLKKNKSLLLLVLPGALWLAIFCYLPMVGTVIAFKDFRISSDGFFASIMQSEWVGFENFQFLFSTNDAITATKNTILYNFGFITAGVVAAIFIAVVMSEISNKRLVKTYQTGILLPYFLSWVVISYFVFTFLSTDKGLLNDILGMFGLEDVSWYTEPQYWPFILVFMGVWKGVGYSSIIYFAAIMGIDRSYYEAAMVDGATKWQQFTKVTIPQLLPLMTVLIILDIGRIFRADFGLFFQIPRNSGPLYDVTNVLDTFIYRGLTSTGDLGMATAAGLYQSVVGLLLVLLTNWIVRRLDSESALF
ncbi:MAG: ABC transporter permease [Bacilli bacterium]